MCSALIVVCTSQKCHPDVLAKPKSLVVNRKKGEQSTTEDIIINIFSKNIRKLT